MILQSIGYNMAHSSRPYILYSDTGNKKANRFGGLLSHKHKNVNSWINKLELPGEWERCKNIPLYHHALRFRFIFLQRQVVLKDKKSFQ